MNDRHSLQCQGRSPQNQSPLTRRRTRSRRPSTLLRRRSKLFQALFDSCPACLIDELKGTGNCDVNRKETDGYTPLMVAVEVGKLEVVDFLINQGALVDLRNDWGETALYLAVSQSGPDTRTIVERLLWSGGRSTVNIPSTSGCVPLFKVAGRCRDVDLTLAISEELVEANADLNVKGSNPDVLNGRCVTSFELAATVGNFLLCQFLYRAGCDVSVVHEWMRHNSFPRLLRKQREWVGVMVAWATEPMTLEELCRLKICNVIRNNGYDARRHVTDLGLPHGLTKMLLNHAD